MNSTHLQLKPLNNEAAEWLEKLAQQNNHFDFSVLTHCCQLIETYHPQTAINTDGMPSILNQGFTIAEELIPLGCDSSTLAAAIIFPAFQHHFLTIHLVEEHLGPVIAKLITGVQKMEAIQYLDHFHTQNRQQNQVDNLRKMSLAMVDDVRIVLIKISERLSILKYLRNATPEKQQAEAKQIMNIYAPLANRLGVGQFKWQLEDLSFRYLYKEQYNEISKALKMRRSDREAYIKNFINLLTHLLNKNSLTSVSISGRAKHIYSIYRKIQRKQVDLSEIYDMSAVRILVPSVQDCYTVLSHVHNEWPHIEKEFDDYIAKPKANGYRSIHTVITGPDQINVEIQIRTYQMHDQAELGVAAHWKYKEGSATQSSYEQKINWLRSVIDWQRQVSKGEAESLLKQTFDDRIYVFTPTGDIFDLEAGATPLDFAYHVHTEIGHRCRGAKVNNVMVPLSHLLVTGDQVSILTGREPHPSRDWLNPDLGYLKTPRALHKVRNWFKRQSQEIYLEKGQQLWEKVCRRENINRSIIDNMFEEFNVKTLQDLLIAIGSGEVGVNTIINRIKHPHAEENVVETVLTLSRRKKIPKLTSGQSDFTIEGVDDLLTQLAKCCKPIPGDNIIGYITKGRGVTIHQQNCRNISYALQHYPERIVNANWVNQKKNSFPVELAIEAENRNDLIRDISNLIASENIPLLSLNSRVNPLNHITFVHLTIQIKNLDDLSQVLAHLRQVASVTQVSRV